MTFTQFLAGWLLLAVPVTYYAVSEIKSAWGIKKLNVTNVVPIVFFALLLGARWPLTAVERAAKSLARIRYDQH